ncbi:MAG: hypothetical protein ACFFBD_15500 [Candidatus Hodarchaeota archaeon]
MVTRLVDMKIDLLLLLAGTIVLLIQNSLLILEFSFQYVTLDYLQSPEITYLFILDLIGYSLLAMGCFLFAVRSSDVISPVVASICFLGWVFCSIVWRFSVGVFMGLSFILLNGAFFFPLGGILFLVAFYYCWRSFEGWDTYKVLLGSSMLYSISNLVSVFLIILLPFFLLKTLIVPILGLGALVSLFYIILQVWRKKSPQKTVLPRYRRMKAYKGRR